MKKNSLITIFLSFVISFFLFSDTVNAATNIKIAILAPKGSTWDKQLTKLATDVKNKTKGEVILQFIGGGVMGDEDAVLRKMTTPQLQGGAFTGIGLGKIVPDVRVFEAPMLFSNTSQVDSALSKITGTLEKKFNDKGYQLLGWAETGFVYVYSNTPIKSLKDMNGVKMWMWKGDPIAQAIFSEFKLSPNPLDITEVLTSLQTGLINGAYGPPLAAIAFQWHTKVKYMLNVPLAYSIGALIITDQTWKKLKPDQQKILKDCARAHLKTLVSNTRSDDKKALQTLKAAGIKFTNPDPTELKNIKDACRRIQEKLAGSLYSKDLLNQIR